MILNGLFLFSDFASKVGLGLGNLGNVLQNVC